MTCGHDDSTINIVMGIIIIIIIITILFFYFFKAHQHKAAGVKTKSGTHDFLLTFHSNHRPISHRSRDKRRFPSKIANFSHPRVFNAPTEGIPLRIWYRRKGQKKLE